MSEDEATASAVTTEDLLEILTSINKRADRLTDDKVVATYVDMRAIRSALSSSDNGVIFGRRGTGKTHALKYLIETERAKGNFVAFVDMETDTGSTGGLYSDPNKSAAERATRLLVDILSVLHTRLFDESRAGRSIPNVDLLNRLAASLKEVIVVDELKVEEEAATSSSEGVGFAVDVTPKGFTGKASYDDTQGRSARELTSGTGPLRHRIQFGEVSRVLRELFKAHDGKRCWIVIDEWTAVPLELQPYVAQMLRSIAFGIPNVTVRIAAIAHRAEWKIPGERGTYLGLEVGSELFTLFDLDDFAVFPARNRDAQKSRSTTFFQNLLFKHVSQALKDDGRQAIANPEAMVALLFTQITALHELVKASEGVPRDALSIISLAATRVDEGTRISTDDIRQGAAMFFQANKETHLNGVPRARQLLDAIRKSVISGKKARAFLLLQQHSREPLIQQLIDDRLLHLIKRGYSSKGEPGARYDVIEIDYGLYVDMLGTTAAPQSLLGEGGGEEDDTLAVIHENVDVPDYDYRSIRRSVLDLPKVLAELTD